MRLRQLIEAISRTGKGDTAVVGWGRGMGHKGHMMLASSVITKAKDVGGDPYFVVSRTFGKDDPLTADEKLAIYKKVFPKQGHIFQSASDELPDLTRVLTNLNQQGYKNAVIVVGADQVKAFQYLKQYNGKPDKAGNIAFNFDSLDVISRQETGDPSAGEEGPRATPMRQVLMDPNATPEEQFKVWRDAMSPEVSDDEVRDLMAKAKERMAQFAAPKPKKAKGVAEEFGPLPKDNQQIRLGRHTVDIERVGKDKNYIGFAWHDSKGQEHYEEVAVGDLGSYDDLIKRIKDEIRFQERQYTEQGVAEVSDFTKQSYKAKAQAQVKELEPHAKKGEYKDIAQRAIDRRTKGLARVNKEDAAGVGIITKQNTTKDVNKGTLRKMMKAYKLI